MISEIKIGAALVAAASALAAGFTLGWTVEGWRASGALEGLKARHAQETAAGWRNVFQAQKRTEKERDVLADKLAEAGALAATQKGKDDAENQRLRDCLRRGTCGLRIAATCAAGRSDVRVPEAAAGSVGGGDNAPQLTEAAGADYLALLEGLKENARNHAACVQSLTRITGQKPVVSP